MGPTIRNEAPDRAATTTPAAASGGLRTASIGRRRGPLGVSGGDLVNASGMSAAQHSSARMLYDTELTGVSTLIINCEASDPPHINGPISAHGPPRGSGWSLWPVTRPQFQYSTPPRIDLSQPASLPKRWGRRSAYAPAGRWHQWL
jgi:hypothetical protein